jgi:hypothetical protein
VSTILAYEHGLLWSHKDRPILAGFQLLHNMCLGNRVIVATNNSREALERKLRTERLQDLIADVVDETVSLPPLPIWKRQFELIRSQYSLSMVLTADPEIVSHAIEEMVPSLFFSHPGFAESAKLPVVGARNWENILEELEIRP